MSFDAHNKVVRRVTPTEENQGVANQVNEGGGVSTTTPEVLHAEWMYVYKIIRRRNVAPVCFSCHQSNVRRS